MSAVTVTALCWLAGWLGDVSCHCHSSVLVGWGDRWMSAVTVTAVYWLAGLLMDVSCHCHSCVLVGWVVDGCQLSLSQLCTGWLGC